MNNCPLLCGTLGCFLVGVLGKTFINPMSDHRIITTVEGKVSYYVHIEKFKLHCLSVSLTLKLEYNCKTNSLKNINFS